MEDGWKGGKMNGREGGRERGGKGDVRGHIIRTCNNAQ